MEFVDKFKVELDIFIKEQQFPENISERILSIQNDLIDSLQKGKIDIEFFDSEINNEVGYALFSCKDNPYENLDKIPSLSKISQQNQTKSIENDDTINKDELIKELISYMQENTENNSKITNQENYIKQLLDVLEHYSSNPDDCKAVFPKRTISSYSEKLQTIVDRYNRVINSQNNILCKPVQGKK
ncbi:hypothetical protein TVAG_119120 [Trichomonas vaginalis G3]|uniref:Uncharacterized protein n=1 Tax=Trichomonas vaginalis (strain ATCC PRA-98 / G3) TaxID=412133 RepID=A2D759_TRIV3|nr:hypothetical protein TVAGG3_0991810 [Trichomonas vaginalis G3]EAY23576.1 hypothetical protein TVAG_119120 [Trichomonas vaginalis G3]KAI5490073.1 hypothetical protein TVAGG3_0991810 [Trichomonas vaginalis G3]|eukprot:XP_001276824.1 hypothetical protein [Trichomonas vaginalis G3]